MTNFKYKLHSNGVGNGMEVYIILYSLKRRAFTPPGPQIGKPLYGHLSNYLRGTGLPGIRPEIELKKWSSKPTLTTNTTPFLQYVQCEIVFWFLFMLVVNWRRVAKLKTGPALKNAFPLPFKTSQFNQKII